MMAWPQLSCSQKEATRPLLPSGVFRCAVIQLLHQPVYGSRGYLHHRGYFLNLPAVAAIEIDKLFVARTGGDEFGNNCAFLSRETFCGNRLSLVRIVGSGSV